MKISSVPDVKSLKPAEKDELLAEIARELLNQRAENDQLKKMAERANSGMAVWKALTTISGALIALGIGIIWIGGEWKAWEDIKEIHRVEATSGRPNYEHSNLDSKAIDHIRSKLDLPDFSRVVQYGEPLEIESDDQKQGRLLIARRGGPGGPVYNDVRPPPSYPGSAVWTLRKPSS